VATATYKVEIDFENATGGAGVYQAAGGTITTYAASTTSYTAQQAYAVSTTDTFGGLWDDVTRDVTLLKIKRGRDNTGGPFSPGVLTMTLQRVASPNDAPSVPGGKELYNPASTTSPLSSYYTGSSPAGSSPGISPLRPCRVTMTNNGTSRVLFYGFLTGWRYNRDTGEADVTAQDVLWKTSRVRPSFTQAANETTSSAIGRILDAAAWTAPSDRNLNPTIQTVSAGTGDALPASSLSPDGIERTGLDLIDELLTTNRGWVYQRGGVVTYENRQARSLRKVADQTITNVALDYEPGFEVE
jgi:hypothetical protein